MTTHEDRLEAAFLTPAFFENPYPVYAEMRDKAPVIWSEKLSTWLVSRYEDCATILQSSKDYSSAGRVAYLLDQLPADLQEMTQPLRAHYAVGLAHSDPPSHTRLKKIMRSGINGTMSRSRRERIRTLVCDMLDELMRQGGGDLVEKLAYPLPATVVTELIGAPIADIGKFKRWGDIIAALFERGGTMTQAAALDGLNCIAEIRDYIRFLKRHIAENPGDNIMTLLMKAESEGEDRMSEQELVSTAVTLFVAGHETTTNLISMTLKALFDFPDQREKLIQTPSLMTSAVEECLRHASVIPRAWRMTTAPVTIAGVDIPERAMVMAMLGAANYDESIFEDPNQLKLARKPNRHFGFGSGIHSCLGAPLARIELEVVLEELLAKAPKYAVSGPPVWRQDFAIRGLKTLPVSF